MTLTVIENAYLRKAEEIPSFSNNHKKILSLLTHEKKYYVRNELLHLTNYSEKTLDKILSELSQSGLITLDGWLVKLNDFCENPELLIK